MTTYVCENKADVETYRSVKVVAKFGLTLQQRKTVCIGLILWGDMGLIHEDALFINQNKRFMIRIYSFIIIAIKIFMTIMINASLLTKVFLYMLGLN